jgi:putative transposase
LLADGWSGDAPGKSRIRTGEKTLWQRRYWERILKDDDDVKRHLDYIHYNPVKHGLVKRAGDWPYSSFKRFVELEEYASDWGEAMPDNLKKWDTPNME